MNQLKVRLMYQEALRRLQDAETLSDAMLLSEQSDSPYLLRLLGLELLLKLVHELVNHVPAPNHHQYEKIFEKLPSSLQDRLLSLAGERVGPSALASKHPCVLQEWGANFIALRYPWERYKNMSEEEYSQIGKTWVEKGAPLDDATFRYYPEELVGFIAALRIVVGEFVEGSVNSPAPAGSHERFDISWKLTKFSVA